MLIGFTAVFFVKFCAVGFAVRSEMIAFLCWLKLCTEYRVSMSFLMYCEIYFFFFSFNFWSLRSLWVI